MTQTPSTCPAPSTTASAELHALADELRSGATVLMPPATLGGPGNSGAAPTGWKITGHKDHIARIQPCARCGLMVRYGVEISATKDNTMLFRGAPPPPPVQVGARCAYYMIGAEPPKDMKHDVPPTSPVFPRG